MFFSCSGLWILLSGDVTFGAVSVILKPWRSMLYLTMWNTKKNLGLWWYCRAPGTPPLLRHLVIWLFYVWLFPCELDFQCIQFLSSPNIETSFTFLVRLTAPLVKKLTLTIRCFIFLFILPHYSILQFPSQLIFTTCSIFSALYDLGWIKHDIPAVNSWVIFARTYQFSGLSTIISSSFCCIEFLYFSLT